MQWKMPCVCFFEVKRLTSDIRTQRRCATDKIYALTFLVKQLTPINLGFTEKWAAENSWPKSDS